MGLIGDIVKKGVVIYNSLYRRSVFSAAGPFGQELIAKEKNVRKYAKEGQCGPEASICLRDS